MGRRSSDKKLHLEDYEFYFDNLYAADFTLPQLNQIIHMHGFFKPRGKKAELQEALSRVNTLLEPRRSTLNETLSPYKIPNITEKQVNADLDALQWQETPVQSLQSLSYSAIASNKNKNNNNNKKKNNRCRGLDDNGGARFGEWRGRRVRVRKAKERKVFDAVHLTKPRSRKSVPKRKHLDDIGIGNSACLG